MTHESQYYSFASRLVRVGVAICCLCMLFYLCISSASTRNPYYMLAKILVFMIPCKLLMASASLVILPNGINIYLYYPWVIHLALGLSAYKGLNLTFILSTHMPYGFVCQCQWVVVQNWWHIFAHLKPAQMLHAFVQYWTCTLYVHMCELQSFQLSSWSYKSFCSIYIFCFCLELSHG